MADLEEVQVKAEVSEARRFLSMEEVSKIFGVAYLTIFRGCQNKEIPSVKLGNRRFIPRAWVDDLATKYK